MNWQPQAEKKGEKLERNWSKKALDKKTQKSIIVVC
jgi:hypothetical protein